MSTEDSKMLKHSNGKKLWILWVFGLGFFAGFLVCLVVADKIKNNGATPASVEQVMPAQKPEPVTQADPVRVPASHEVEGEQNFVMTKEMRDRLLTLDFLKLMQDAEIHRYRHEGETRGILLSKIRSGSIYEKLGFKDGDVIEQINGIALADIDSKKSQMKDLLPGANEIEFRIRRDDRVRKIRVKIADAQSEH